MKKSIFLCFTALFMITSVLTAQAPEWQWATQAGGTDDDWCSGIGVDTNGNSYVAGYFMGSITLGDIQLTGNGSYDIFVAKMDSDGDWLWAKQVGGSNFDVSYNLRTDANGNSYLTGKFKGTVNFGDITVTSIGTYDDIFVAKIDTNGDWQWVQNAGGTSSISGNNISLDANGNLYVTGGFYGTATFGPSMISSYGDWDIFVAKLDTNGNWLWAKRAGSFDYDMGNSISVDANGNSYVTGKFQYTASFGDFTITSGGSYDIFIAKLDTDGNWQWAKQAGGTGYNVGYWISAEASGNAYVTGRFKEIAMFGDYSVTSIGSNDIFIAELDTEGNWQWAKQAGGTGSDTGDVIGIDTNGNLYVTGKFRDTANFGDFTLTSIVGYDVFVTKLSVSIVGDFNADGYVDASDLQLLGDHWHFVDTDPGWDAMYDLTPDGIIDAADLQIFGDHWHEGTPPTLNRGDGSKGPNAGAGIEFDLDVNTSGNQHVTAISSQPAGTYIRLDVYATGVHNLDTYEFEVVYDATELDYISSSATNPLTYEENILTSEGGTAVGWMVDTSTPGVLGIAYTLTGTDTLQAPEGEGLVGDIVFKALVDTYGELSFDGVYYYDTFGVVDNILNTGTATLPVELSAFTATYNTTNGYTAINWTTASETDIIGFNIYRSTEDEYETSKKINSDIIAGQGTTTEISKYEFIDIDQLNYGTTYYYWLESVEFDGINIVYSSINLKPEQGSGGFVDDFQENLLTNYPNPCYGTTTIQYGIKGMLRSEPVQIKIFNILGQQIDTVEGRYGTAIWNTSGHVNGIYFYKLDTENFCEINKMIVTQ